MNRNIFFQVVFFLLYLFLQVLILKNVVFFHTGFILFYIAFLLFLPVETTPLALMAVGFTLGFAVDIFYDSLGVHVSACVATAYARNYWIAVLTPQGGYDAGSEPRLAALGIQWFIVYLIPMLVIHQLVLFFVEAGGFTLAGFTLLKVGFSTLLTFLALLTAEIIFARGRR
jgi:hypothetical protein